MSLVALATLLPIFNIKIIYTVAGVTTTEPNLIMQLAVLRGQIIDFISDLLADPYKGPACSRTSTP